jgi:hypothetical protein
MFHAASYRGVSHNAHIVCDLEAGPGEADIEAASGGFAPDRSRARS